MRKNALKIPIALLFAIIIFILKTVNAYVCVGEGLFIYRQTVEDTVRKFGTVILWMLGMSSNFFQVLIRYLFI